MNWPLGVALSLKTFILSIFQSLLPLVLGDANYSRKKTKDRALIQAVALAIYQGVENRLGNLTIPYLTIPNLS